MARMTKRKVVKLLLEATHLAEIRGITPTLTMRLLQCILDGDEKGALCLVIRLTELDDVMIRIKNI